MMRYISGFMVLLGAATLALSASVKIPMHLVLKGDHDQYIGYVLAEDTQYGLLLMPHLSNLPAGVHGFHVHVRPSCKDHGMAAGGHLDPLHTGKHLGPYNAQGHLGDLPVLIVDKQGQAKLPILAPRLTVKDIRHHALMVHEGGDNYSDEPKPLGGGGARLACGVIK